MIDEIRSRKAWAAFQALAEWIWSEDLPGLVNDNGSLVLPQQASRGFAEAQWLNALLDISKGFTQSADLSAVADLLELALEKQFALYEVGLQLHYIQNFTGAVTVLDFYAVEEGIDDYPERTANKARLREELINKGILSQSA